MDPVSVQLSPFAVAALQAEANRQGVSLGDLVAHAAMYYLADIHTGRAAVQIFRRSVADKTPPRSAPVELSPRREDAS